MYKLVGALGPILLQCGDATVLGRKTHKQVYKEKRCSRNQLTITVSPKGDDVTLECTGLNVGRLTKKGEHEAKDLQLKKPVLITPGDKFTLFGGEYPFTLVKGDDESDSDTDEDSTLQDHKRKRDDNEGDDKDEKAKKSDNNGKGGDSGGDEKKNAKKVKTTTSDDEGTPQKKTKQLKTSTSDNEATPQKTVKKVKVSTSDDEATPQKNAKKVKISSDDEAIVVSKVTSMKTSSSDDEDDEEEPPKKKVASKSKTSSDTTGDNSDNDGKEICKYGAHCYRKNAEHRMQFYHPPHSPDHHSTTTTTTSSPPPKSPKSPKSTAKTTTSTTTTSSSSASSSVSSSPKGSKSGGGVGDIYYKSLKWRTYESVIILDTNPLPPADKIAAFDMDSTLIKTKSGNVFAKSRDDWQWLYKEVPKKLQSLHNEGYRLMIFSNQGGKSTDMIALKGKVMDLISAIKVPIITFLSTGKDRFRKPNCDVWEYMISEVNGGVVPSDCYYIGDAAGRSPDGDLRPKRDFSCSDREFAANLGIDFKTPEEFFLGHKPAPYKHAFDPKTFKDVKLKLHTGDTPLTSKKQELIICVGRPASGKSTFVKKHLVPKGYVHVNQDTLKTKAKCLAATKTALAEGKSVVVDNTNPSPDTRAEYLQLANAKKVGSRCFYFNTSMDLANHLNKFREIQTEGETKKVADIAYRVYQSKYKPPSTNEGFSEVKEINFIPEFTKSHHEELFYKFM